MEAKLSRYLIGFLVDSRNTLTVTRQATFSLFSRLQYSAPPPFLDEEEYPAPLQPMIPRPLTLFLQLRGKTGEWAEKRNGGCTGSRGFHFSKGLWLVLVLLCAARTNAQVYFGHCFSNLEQADGDSNGELTAEEYATFVVAYTDGAMELPLPPAVSEPFQVLSLIHI